MYVHIFNKSIFFFITFIHSLDSLSVAPSPPVIHVFLEIKMVNGQRFKSSYLLLPLKSALQPKPAFTHSHTLSYKGGKGHRSTLLLLNGCDQQIPPTQAIRGSVSCPRTLPHSAEVRVLSTDPLINGVPALCVAPRGFATLI